MKAAKPTCPICEKAMPGPWQEWPQYPFCSPRCKTIDLGRWLSEDYAVAKPVKDEPSDDASDDAVA